MSGVTASFRRFAQEFKRRQVARACILYIIACWVVLQVCDILLESLGGDMTTVSRILLIVSVLGLPLIAAFAWFYQISAKGISRTPPFTERRILDNIAILDDRRREAPSRGNPARHESSYDWILEVCSGPLSGLRYGMEEDIHMGRSSECELTVPVGHISRRHARFRMDEDGLVVEDLQSSNGTRVNGQKIAGPVMLHHHDLVEIPNVEIKILENLARSRRGGATTKHTLQLEDAANTRKNQ